MRSLRTSVALVLVYLFIPGALHATEHLVQLVGHGHVTEAEVHADHHEPGSEHDCSGLFHTCVCHASPVVTLADRAGSPGAPTPRAELHRISHDDRVLSGFPHALFRPPIA